MPVTSAPAAASLSWTELDALLPAGPDEVALRIHGPTNAQAELRLFGRSESELRVTLYRDNHAWCPYCQKVWLWLEEQRIPYRVRKVTMHCYGEKEDWYRRLVPSGMLPALELDGRLITESDLILHSLEGVFGPLGRALDDPEVFALRQLERRLFRAWCQWLCYAGPLSGGGADPFAEPAARHFTRMAELVEQALEALHGPWFLDGFSSADVVFVPYLERMNASLAYYKGYGLRQRHPAIDRWFSALEQRSTYLGTQGDFHTHAHDLPPQMGCCLASGSPVQWAAAAAIDGGPWPSANPALIETRQAEPPGAAFEAVARVLKHRERLLALNPEADGSGGPRLDQALRAALTTLVGETPCAPPAGTAAGLRYLRDRISVPRDMSVHAARRLRWALETTAALDGPAPGPEIPSRHRRDQDPTPFRAARTASLPA